MQQVCPSVSAVVINVRGTDLLETCLQSLTQTNYPNMETIVVDCQTAHIDSWMKKHFPMVKVVHFDEDIGSSASHNIGAAKARPKSTYVAFLDNDTIVEPNWLSESVKLLDENKKTGIVQPKIMRIGSEGRLDHAGLALDALGTWSTSFDMDEKDFDRVFDLFAASFAACVVRRKVFELLGGFDEDYFIYDDDTDFCWRTHLMGHRIVFAPKALVHHRGSATKTLTPKRQYHSVKNRVCTMLKNYELRNLWSRVLSFYILSFLSAFSFALLHKLEMGLAMIKGLSYPVQDFRRIWKKRLSVQSSRKINDKELFRSGVLRRDMIATLFDVKRKAVDILGGSTG